MNRELSGRQLTVARGGWIVFALLLTTLHLAGQVAFFRQANASDLMPAQLQGLAEMGVSVPVYLFFNVVLLLFFPVFWGGMGLLILWRKSNERGALIVSAMMVGAGMAATIPVWEAFATAYPKWVWIVPLAAFVGNLCVNSFFFVFPNGRFVPRWAIGIVPLLSAYNILNGYAFALPPFGVELGERLAWLFPIFITLSLLGFLAPFYRYRRVSTAIEREQIKWVVFAIIVGITIFAATA
ncbi:MAG: hypothetical protein KF770_32265, partial [Anaerolineae bacterium]|nr:hypothetical protein [Anaerolineae bacterium]